MDTFEPVRLFSDSSIIVPSEFQCFASYLLSSLFYLEMSPCVDIVRCEIVEPFVVVPVVVVIDEGCNRLLKVTWYLVGYRLNSPLRVRRNLSILPEKLVIEKEGVLATVQYGGDRVTIGRTFELEFSLTI